MAYLALSVVVWLTYLAFTQNLEPSNLVVGLLIGLAVSTVARSGPQPQQSRFNLKRLATSTGALLYYIFRLLIDIVKSGIAVARYILDPRLPIQPGIIAIPAQTDDPKIIAISAHGITITPGEMVVEIGEDGVMYTHCLDVMASGDISDKSQTARKKLLEKVLQS